MEVELAILIDIAKWSLAVLVAGVAAILGILWRVLVLSQKVADHEKHCEEYRAMIGNRLDNLSEWQRLLLEHQLGPDWEQECKSKKSPKEKP